MCRAAGHDQTRINMADNNQDEIMERLQAIQDDVNDIQGDVRVLSTLNKGLNRAELKNLIHDSLGNSKNKKLVWYYADGRRTNQEIAETADIPKGSVDWAVSELNKSGWLVKNERGNKVIYDKSEVCTNIGIEGEIEKDLDL